MAKKSKAPAKATVKKRTLNAPAGGTSKKKTKRNIEAGFNVQDPQRRLGNFVTAGEHARQGGREQGLVGQTKQKFGTDKQGSKKGARVKGASTKSPRKKGS